MPGRRAVATHTAAAITIQFASTRTSITTSALVKPAPTKVCSSTGSSMPGSCSRSLVLTMRMNGPCEASNSAPIAVQDTSTTDATSNQPIRAIVMPKRPNSAVYWVTSGAM